ncbi:MAG: RagB/SusD family nutrient uptake outer membrane protein [Gemmatimonadaceae bacterium]
MTTSKLQTVRRFGRALLVAPLILVGQSCTSLTEVPHDALTPDNAFKTETELLAGVAAVYANLRAMEWVGYVTLQDLTTDVSIVPTRGSDWYDNGRWLEIHRQTWTANSGSALDDMNGAWNNMFAGVAKANLMIDVVTNAKTGANAATTARLDSTLAELRTLRAWYYYMLQDMFGGAPPLVTTTELKKYPSSTRTELFTFITSELTAALPDLPATRPATQYGRVTKSAANAILASMYVNGGVFNRNTGVSATAYNPCLTADCNAAITNADAVINSGNYTLSPAGQWATNFSQNNTASPENIFVIVYTSEGQGLGGCWPWRTLDYNQLRSGGGPWNGFATTAETFNTFGATDERRGMWLFGVQSSFDTGLPVNDRTGNPLIFTAAIPDANQANEAQGVRFNKFPPFPGATGGCGMPNDFPFFRLTEMYLIKAEAQNESGQTPAAIATLNTVRNLRFPGNPVAGGSTQQEVRDAILRERLLEFAAEGKRRTDLVRHGRFTSWSEASLNGVCGPTGICGAARDPKLILFPVPVTQIGSNPNLVQNPGY